MKIKWNGARQETRSDGTIVCDTKCNNTIEVLRDNVISFDGKNIRRDAIQENAIFHHLERLSKEGHDNLLVCSNGIYDAETRVLLHKLGRKVTTKVIAKKGRVRSDLDRHIIRNGESYYLGKDGLEYAARNGAQIWSSTKQKEYNVVFKNL